MRTILLVLVVLLGLRPVTTVAAVKLDGPAEAELKLLCKTRLKPVRGVDWDDFCSCVTGTIENDFTRPQYLAWRNALANRSPIPDDAAVRKMWSGCVVATTPLQPGTEIIIPALPPKKP